LQTRAGSSDMVSCILYRGTANIHFRHQSLDADVLTRNMMQVGADGDTHFGNAIKELEVVLKTSPATHIPIAFFMTDGGCSDDGASDTLKEIMKTYGPSGFTFHSVLVGGCSPQELVLLKLLAEIGKGTMSTSKITLADMKNTYAALAALLE